MSTERPWTTVVRAGALSVVLSTAQLANAAETLIVPATDSTGVTSPVLEDGVVYEVRATGTYEHAYAGQRADAEWHQIYPDGEWEEWPGELQHDLLIDGVEYDWEGWDDSSGSWAAHQYSPSHEYRLFLTGEGEAVQLSVHDSQYGDNDGLLTVTITPLFPATFSVPATTPTGAYSPPLVSGILYDIHVEGDYEHAYAGQRADAEWHQIYADGEWEESAGDPTHDLLVDGVEYDWWGLAAGVYAPHQLSPDHDYRLCYLGDGVPIQFNIYDVYYGDNSGELQVTISVANDCNDNGVCDDMELYLGISDDCNGNGVLDSCDMADCDGASWCGDCNTNGVLDECEPDFDGDDTIDECDEDIDSDAVLNEVDVCDYTPLTAVKYGRVILDPEDSLYGTIRGDLDGDCDCDLEDYAILWQDRTGPNP